jgi:hypothetical protein
MEPPRCVARWTIGTLPLHCSLPRGHDDRHYVALSDMRTVVTWTDLCAVRVTVNYGGPPVTYACSEPENHLGLHQGGGYQWGSL